MPPTVRRFATPLIIVATVVSISLLAARSRFARTSREIPANKVATNDKAATVSTTSADVNLTRDIDRAIDESNLTQARWGVFVMSLNDGRVLCSRNGDQLFTPASNMKVYTTAVALDVLGPDYRWRTSVFAYKQPDANGVIEGDLTLYGRGAPDLVSYQKNSAPSLLGLVEQLYQHGIREVRGNIVGDDSYFRGEPYGVGWQWNDLQWYYGAEPSALTIDANAINLTISPASKVGEAARLKLERGSDYVQLINSATTSERSLATTIGIYRGVSDNNVRVWGEFPVGGHGFGAYLSVHNPALWAARLFKEALLARGIKVDGETSSRDFRVAESEKFDPDKAVEIATTVGATLGEAVRETNKHSNNLYAELILRTLGKEKAEPASDTNARKNREHGDDEAGVAVVKLWLKRNGIDSDKLAIHDGSGLSRLDLVTPEATARLLAAIARSGAGQVFHDSLPIAGRDGTLGSRLSHEAGRVFAKTGTVTYDHSLSGYAVTDSNEILAFSIFCNDAIGRSDPVRLIDQITSLIVSYDRQSKSK